MTIDHRDILDNLLNAVVILNEELSILYMNQAAESFFCTSGFASKVRFLSDYFASGSQVPKQIREALKGGSLTMRQSSWKLRSGRRAVVDFSVTANDSGDQLILEIQSLDRLLRISRDESMLASQDTTHSMMRSMAHEIKNPLGGIRGAAQLLERELPGEDLNEFTRVIIDEADRLRNLTDRMLGPNRPLKQDQINIHEVLEHVRSVIQLQDRGQVDIVRDYDPSIPDLLGDKEQLIQAIMNIVNNAFEALTENDIPEPNVRLKTRVKRRHTIGKRTHSLVALICVIDNGPGIPEHIMENIFFPMITGRAEGTGLGLTISQNLIARHNGLIECASAPGRTEFSIYLPL